MRAISPRGVRRAMPSAAGAVVGLERGAKAGIITPISACASGAEAIAHAWHNIVLGETDIAICGGVETKIETVPIVAFASVGLSVDA
jgi:meromycolic acid 3-oxoacyl-[acyl-carrier protein] synthase II